MRPPPQIKAFTVKVKNCSEIQSTTLYKLPDILPPTFKLTNFSNS